MRPRCALGKMGIFPLSSFGQSTKEERTGDGGKASHVILSHVSTKELQTDAHTDKYAEGQTDNSPPIPDPSFTLALLENRRKILLIISVSLFIPSFTSFYFPSSIPACSTFLYIPLL